MKTIQRSVVVKTTLRTGGTSDLLWTAAAATADELREAAPSIDPALGIVDPRAHFSAI
jgi:hypothetical protein